MMRKREEWWEPYVKPLPTWDIYDPKGYATSLGMLRSKPPSPEFTKPEEKGRVTGIIIGEGTLGFFLDLPYGIYIYIKAEMMEKPPIDLVTQMLGLKTYTAMYKEVVPVYHFWTQGLRGYFLANYTKDLLLGKRREIAQFMVTHGYTIKPETLEQFKRRFPRISHRYVQATKEGSQQVVWREAYLIPPERPPL